MPHVTFVYYDRDGTEVKRYTENLPGFSLRALNDAEDALRAKILCKAAGLFTPLNYDIDECGDFDERTGTLDVWLAP